MKISLRQVNRENYQALIDLKVSEEQQNFVAPNWRSLLHAAYEPELNLLAIYKDEAAVGLLLYDFDEKMGGWTLSRLMIDHSYQQQGIASQALAQFLAFFKKEYLKQDIYTSAELDNSVAQNLYEKFGFEKQETFSYENGGMTFHEVKMVKGGQND
ncbi:MAG: GNAT family N-acetyltransferase [Streptococcaceae bacterium]|nr:GNAT family N-acetyltransferase [Streptococcaceae bacterium]